MSDRISKKNDEKDEEVKYLTLADKQPSFMSGTISPKSISTRELSDNLQKTRDGLIFLMKKGGEGNDRIRTTRDSDSEAEDEDDFQNFGMPIRSKGTRDNTQHSDVDGTKSNEMAHGIRQLNRNGEMSSNEMANGMRQINRNGKMSSKEWINAGSNEYGGNDESNMYGHHGHAQRGKSRGNDKGGYDDIDEIHKGGSDYNELLSSQNPKKDGPLCSRIFIDAFLPSLEGNRIFPLFNYRCAEKIDRMSENYYENQKRKLSKNLLPVTLEDSELGNYSDRAEDNEIEEELLQKRNRKSSSAYESREMRKVEDSQELLVLQSIEQVQQAELKNEIKPTTSQKNGKTENLIQTSIENLPDEDKAAVDASKVEQTASEIESSKPEELPPSTDIDSKLEQDDSPKFSGQENVSSALAAQIKVEETFTPIEVEEPSAEEQKLLLKLLNALLANDELIDIFCERIISKISARNDFCGPDCKSTCGGCNKPKNSNAD